MPLSISSLQLPLVECPLKNHYSMPLQYINLSLCKFRTNTNILCYYCYQQLLQQTKQHKSSSTSLKQNQTVSLKQFIIQCVQKIQQKYYHQQQPQNVYKLEQMFIRAINNIKSKLQLQQVVNNLYTATYTNQGNERLESILNVQIQELKNKIDKHYLHNQTNNTNINININTNIYTDSYILNKNNNKNNNKSQEYSPVLSFKQNNNFILQSPFSIISNKQKQIQSILAYPSLNTFNQSLEICIKIQKVTPNWMAIGLFIDNNHHIANNNTQINNNNNSNLTNTQNSSLVLSSPYIYSQASPNHISLLSNGYLNNKSTLVQFPNLKYKSNDIITIKYNKNQNSITFINNQNRSKQTVQCKVQWNQEVYLSVTMFYKTDKISILNGAMS